MKRWKRQNLLTSRVKCYKRLPFTGLISMRWSHFKDVLNQCLIAELIWEQQTELSEQARKPTCCQFDSHWEMNWEYHNNWWYLIFTWCGNMKTIYYYEIWEMSGKVIFQFVVLEICCPVVRLNKTLIHSFIHSFKCIRVQFIYLSFIQCSVHDHFMQYSSVFFFQIVLILNCVCSLVQRCRSCSQSLVIKQRAVSFKW